MGIPQKSLVIGACEIACHYPELSLNDAAGDALQLAEKIRLYGIEENKRKRLSLSQLAVLSVLIKISRLKKR
jgi:hypothetical protein